MASGVLYLYENPVTQKFDLFMSKNLNSELKKEENCTYYPSMSGVGRSSGALGHGLYGERPMNCTNYINHLLSNSIGQIEHIEVYVEYCQEVLLALHEVLNQILLMFISFLHCTVTGCARRTSGRGSGCSMPSGITTIVHNHVTQSKHAINLSVIN
jgi:hypothetical protein